MSRRQGRDATASIRFRHRGQVRHSSAEGEGHVLGVDLGLNASRLVDLARAYADDGDVGDGPAVFDARLKERQTRGKPVQRRDRAVSLPSPPSRGRPGSSGRPTARTDSALTPRDFSSITAPDARLPRTLRPTSGLWAASRENLGRVGKRDGNPAVRSDQAQGFRQRCAARRERKRK